MDSKLVLSPAIAAAALALSAQASMGAPEVPEASVPDAAAQQSLTFFCNTDGAMPVTALRLTPTAGEAAQVHPLLTWTDEHFPVTERATQLCEQAAGRLQAYALQDDPSQFSFITGEVDGLPAICVEASAGAGCQRDRLLTALAADQDAKAVLLSLTPEANHPEPTPRVRGDFPLIVNPWPVSLTSIVDSFLKS